MQIGLQSSRPRAHSVRSPMKCHTVAHVKIARETRGDKRCATLWVLAGRPLDVRGLAVESARKNHRIDSDIRAVRELKGQEKGNVPTQKTHRARKGQQL